MEIIELINDGKTTREISKILNISQTNVRYKLNKLGLKTKNNIKHHMCKDCGCTDKNKFYSKRKSQCKQCFNKSSVKSDIIGKKKSIEYKGGCCESCGIIDDYVIYDFHHIDQNQKEIEPSIAIRNSFDNAKIELDKCSLLCSNCHRKEHEGKFNHSKESSGNKSRSKWIVGRKIKAIAYLGGKCEDCGIESSHYSIYDFHHKNMTEKEFQFNGHKKWSILQSELNKCEILCSNCHRKRHI